MQRIFIKQSVINFFIPALYISVVLIVDHLIPIGTFTPFFVVIGLVFMALYLRSVVMIPWVIIYTAIVCSIFLVPKLFIFFSGHPYHDPYVTQVLRAGTYFAIGMVFCYLSITLHRFKKNKEELDAILAGLPWPIFTSDQNGKILYWNQSAEKLLPVLSNKQMVYSYFDLLTAPESYGRTIANYMNRLENSKHAEPLELTISDRSFKGYTQDIHWAHKTVLLTILAEVELPSTIIHMASNK